MCEDYWRLPVGNRLPEARPAARRDRAAQSAVRAGDKPLTWVTVGRFTESLAAEPPRIRLEAEGIPTFVEGQRMGSRSMYHVATGGVRLKVPEDLAAEGADHPLARPGRPPPRSWTSRKTPRKGGGASAGAAARLPPVGRSLRSEVLCSLRSRCPVDRAYSCCGTGAATERSSMVKRRGLF